MHSALGNLQSQRARSLFPLRSINAFEAQPQGKRQFPDEGRHKDCGEYPICKVGGQKQREAIRQIAPPSDLQQNAERLRKDIPI